VGKFIALVAASAPAGRWIEIGTSAGYSTLWLALACGAVSGRITTYEISVEKAELAQRTFAAAGVGDVIDLVHGDAVRLERRIFNGRRASADDRKRNGNGSQQS
jgi:caffeoyl-CoA O-methyltransferase